MRPISVTVGPYAAAVANGISTAQALAQAGAFVINGSLVSSGAAILDAPRQVAITSAGNDSAIFFTVTGTDASGNPLGEAVLGSNAGVVTTNNFFKRVTGVRTSGPTSSVTIGTTSGPSSSRAICLDEWAHPPLGVQVAVVGTVAFTVQYSFDEGPDSPTNPVPIAGMFWDSSLIPAGAISGTAGFTFSIPVSPLWIRVLLLSGSGSVRVTVVQYDVVAA